MKIDGTDQAETLRGTPSEDEINGLQGDDEIFGGADDDRLSGGEGKDTVHGDAGQDYLSGDAGDDTLFGGDNYDTLEGGAGRDTIDGGDGSDTLVVTGNRDDYRVEEITPRSSTDPGLYAITDLRDGSPEGKDSFLSIERVRFLDGEMPLADALDRAPTDIALRHVPGTGPRVDESAGKGTLVALLSGVDPDPDEVLTFALIDAKGNTKNASADGRFTIEDDRLLVAADGRFDAARNTSHTLTIRVTDHAGNTFFRDITVGVRPTSSTVTTVVVDLPPGAFDLHLWERQGRGFVATWQAADTTTFQPALFARRVDFTGATFVPKGTATPVADIVLASGNNVTLLGVDDAGNAAIFTRSANHTISWVDTDDGQIISAKTLVQTITGTDNGLSSDLTDQYFFDNGFVGYVETVAHVADSRSVLPGKTANGSDGTFTLATRSASSQGTLFLLDPSGSPQSTIAGLDGQEASAIATDPDDNDRGSRSSTTTTGSDFHVTESGIVTFTRTTISSREGFGPGSSAVSSTTATIGGTVKAGAAGSSSVLATAALAADRFAFVSTDPGARVLLTIVNEQQARTITVEDGAIGAALKALGTSRYLLTYTRVGTGGPIAGGIIFDDFGIQLSGFVSLATIQGLTILDDGTALGITTEATVVDGHAVRRLTARSIFASGIEVTPLTGTFADTDGDGDLDHAGTIFLGHSGGQPRTLRLEKGVYELTRTTLKVQNATVFANIGLDTA